MSEHINKHIGEVHGDLTIICPSAKPANGYLYYYWAQCSCGMLKRYRYDQLRRAGSCGFCEDVKASELMRYVGHGK